MWLSPCFGPKASWLNFKSTSLSLDSISTLGSVSCSVLFCFSYLWDGDEMSAFSNARRSATHHCCLVAQSCLTLCDPMVCSLPGSSVRGIFQARILKWIAIFLSRGSSRPRDWTCVSGIGRFFTTWATRETPAHHKGWESFLATGWYRLGISAWSVKAWEMRPLGCGLWTSCPKLKAAHVCYL